MRQRRLGLTHLTCVVVASMVGAGVFTTSGFALADLGSRRLVLLAWLVGAAIAVCGAITYGELAKRFPRSGGEYLYLRQVLHPLAGFLAGWVSLTAGFTGAIALSATALEAYVLPESSRPDLLPRGLIATAAIAVGTGIHARNVKRGAAVQSAIVVLKLAALLAFTIGGGAFLLVSGTEPPGPGEEGVAAASMPWGAFALSVVWVSLSYSGFNAAIYVAGEAERPERLVPLSMLLATLVVSALYLGLNAVFLYGAPYADVVGRPNVAAVAAEAVGGAWLGVAMRCIVVAALFTSVSAMIMAGPRVYARMAGDGLFPAVFAAVETSPVAAVSFQGALAVLVVWIAGIGELLSYLGLTLGLSALAAGACVLVLERRRWLSGARSRLSAIAPLVFTASTGTAIVLSGRHRPAELTAAVCTLALGAAAYGVTVRLQRGRRSPGTVSDRS